MPGEKEFSISGYTISPGVAFGYAQVDEVMSSERIADEGASWDSAAEVARLQVAIAQVRQDLEDHVKTFHDPHEKDLQRVIAAHLMILGDDRFFREIFDRVERDSIRAERALEDAFGAAADRLTNVTDTYLRARAEDLRDICHTVREALVRGEKGLRASHGHDRDTVFVTTHLHLSTVLRARRAGVLAFVTGSHAFSSHGALFLRASGMPSVGGVLISGSPIRDGVPTLVDAVRGRVTIYPSDRTRRAAARFRAEFEYPKGGIRLPPLCSTTADGVDVALWANVDALEQVRLCFDYRLKGIGLFRTEFLALEGDLALTEEEQQSVYSKIAEELQGRPLVLRTFDLGADKIAQRLQTNVTDNPALGMRGIRRHLEYAPRELDAQLRAILRASAGHDAAVLLPMVTHVAEIRLVRDRLQSLKEQLDRDGAAFNRNLKLGAMIEVPAAALNIREILRAVDFACIGTNDLSQYLSASDRENADLSGYLAPEKSGLYVLMRAILEQARALGRVEDIMVGGELASNPRAAQEFVRIGIRNLIVVPRATPAIREAIASTHAGPTCESPPGGARCPVLFR